MGIFRKDHHKHKDKAEGRDSSSPEPPHNRANSTYINDNSTYGSNISGADTRVSQGQQPPGTTITTVTTTTTTTTTVNPDGSTHVQSHPYNANTDPPPASETISTIPPSNAPSSNRTSNSESFIQPPPSTTPDPHAQYAAQGRRSSTSGGRPIPERAPMPERIPVPEPTPAPDRNSVRNSQDFAITQSPAYNAYQPPKLPALNTYQPPNPPYAHELHAQSNSPTSPVRSNTPNFSRPGPATNGASSPIPNVATNSNRNSNSSTNNANAVQNVPHPLQINPAQTNGVPITKRSSLASAAKGLHGASEAFRGAVNERIASASGDEAERERMRRLKEEGLKEFGESGFREKAEERRERMRLKRRSGQQIGHQGMETVDERRLS